MKICGLFLVSALVLASVNGQKTCGKDSIPYAFAVDVNGKLEISCDQPVCLGPVNRPSAHGKGDDSDEIEITQRLATCPDTFTTSSCSGINEWTSGVEEVNNGTHSYLSTHCCNFDGLNYASQVDVISVKNGEKYIGGAVKENDRLVAFDLIKEVRKEVGPTNEVTYIVHIYRMSCFPAPTRLVNTVDPSLADPEYLANQLAGRSRHTFKLTRRAPVTKQTSVLWPINDEAPVDSRAYGAPTVNGGGDYVQGGIQGYQAQNSNIQIQQIQPEVASAYAQQNQQASQSYVQEQSAQQPIDQASQGFGQQHPAAVVSPGYVQEQQVGPAPSISYAQPQPAVGAGPAYVQQPFAAPVFPQQAVASPGYVQQPVSQYVAPVADNSVYGPQYQQAQYPQYQQNAYPQQQAAYNPGCQAGVVGCAPACPPAGCAPAYPLFQCFSEDMMVETPSGQKSMKDLEVGDMVMGMDGDMMKYSKVVMFLHRKEDEEAHYIHMKSADGNDLKITSYHLMYKSKCKNCVPKLVKAEEVKVGDYIHLNFDGKLLGSRVESIEMIETTGIYAPLTTSGNMFVNGVYVSCHSNYAAQVLQQTFFSWWKSSAALFSEVGQYLLPQQFSKLDSDLPMGVEYLTTVIDMFIPQTF